MSSYRERVAQAIKTDSYEDLYALALDMALKLDRKQVTAQLAGKEPYSEAFEQAWELYPKRDGSNPKREAWMAWHARIQQGTPAVEMIEGTRKYQKWCVGKGIVGTDKVMQARRFYGPSKPFSEVDSWSQTPVHTPSHKGDEGKEKLDMKYVAGIIEGRKAQLDGQEWWERTCAEAIANGPLTTKDVLLYAYNQLRAR